MADEEGEAPLASDAEEGVTGNEESTEETTAVGAEESEVEAGETGGEMEETGGEETHDESNEEGEAEESISAEDRRPTAVEEETGDEEAEGEAEEVAEGEAAARESETAIEEAEVQPAQPEQELTMAQRLMLELEADDLVPDTSTESDVTTEVAQNDLESDEEEEYRITREDLIGEYQSMLEEREELQQRRYFLENKLAEYFRKKRGEEKVDVDLKRGQTADQEQRYVKYMAQLEDLRNEEMMEHERYQREIEDLKSACQKAEREVEEELESFRLYKREVALGAVNSRTGKSLTLKDIEFLEARETQKTSEVVAVRLENIKLKNRLKKREQQLKAKEELAEGLHLIDFEQLKIENQTYNEKIEERNEELLKLRKKITSTVQVLTHLKEKLQFVQAENQVQKANLKVLESSVASKRDILSRTKQARDALRIDNQKLRQNCGMLGNEALLRDFEQRKDESDLLEQKLERLKRQHAELTLSCSGVRKKIEQVRAIRT